MPRPAPQQARVFHALQRRRVRRGGAVERLVFRDRSLVHRRGCLGRQTLPLLVLRHLVAHHVQPAFALYDLTRVAQTLDRGADLRVDGVGVGAKGRVSGAIGMRRNETARATPRGWARRGTTGRGGTRLRRRPSSGARVANKPSSQRSRWRVDPGPSARLSD